MPTKVRILFRVSGAMYHGGNARRQLEGTYKYWVKSLPPRKEINGIARIKMMYDAIPNDGKGLWLFREPKGLAPEKSRFLKLVKYFRIGQRIPRGSRLEVPQAPPRTRTMRTRVVMTEPTISDPGPATTANAFTWDSRFATTTPTWGQIAQEQESMQEAITRQQRIMAERMQEIANRTTRPTTAEPPRPRPRITTDDEWYLDP